jgi:signal transduction histidine kinase
LLAPEDHRRPYENINESLRKEQKTEHLETVCITKNGELIQILLSAAPILDQTGASVGGAYIMWNVTELKMLQRQLVQAQKLESIGQLAAGIAHEINTPIQYIGDNAKFLEEGFRDLCRLVDSGGLLAETLHSGEKADEAAIWDHAAGQIDLEYLRHEVPLAIEQLLQGVDHVAGIVRAMKEFNRDDPGRRQSRN